MISFINENKKQIIYGISILAGIGVMNYIFGSEEIE
jgi:hypothetical protein